MRTWIIFFTAIAAAVTAQSISVAASDTDWDRTVLPRPPQPFEGIAKRSLEGSVPSFTQSVKPPSGAPNILLVLIDDAGFGNPSTFGGPVATPTFDKLAAEGLRYNRFHVTALCSPTRAALLSGRNHHSVGFGSIAEIPGGWPGYSTNWPTSAASIAKILQLNGYNTAAIGKWHLTPDNQQGPAGPFDRWPNALGFDYFWGFLGGETGQFDPVVTENNTIIGVPTDKNFYFNDAMVQHSINWIRGQKAQSPDKPFFLYFSTGATHAPHQVPKEWSDKYKGKFDQGWDQLREQTFARQKQLGVIPQNAKLTPRDPAFPAWDSVSADVKKLYAYQMEVYAGYQENTDNAVGRVVKAIDDMGLADNTLIFYIFGDNGASMEGTETGTFNEMTTLNGVPLTADQQLKAIKAYGGLGKWGGPDMAPHYAAAWAWAGNTPFQWGKQVASHLGGIRNPMVISWPKRIKDKGGVRSQFTHCTDIAPTILEATGLPAPTQVNGVPQMPMHGVSFAFTFADAKAPSRHTQQYFEILGNRAMYKDGWLASWRLDRIPWKIDPETLARFAPGKWNPDQDKCELYNLDEDFSQADNVADKYPDKVAELTTLFWSEAEKYQVLPLLGEMAAVWGFPKGLPDQTKFVYYNGTENISSGMIPPIYNRSYSISADLDNPGHYGVIGLRPGVAGVIVAESSFLGGFSLYVENGHLKHTYSLLGLKLDTISSRDSIPAGKVNVRYEFTADKPGEFGTGGTARLFINGKQQAELKMEHSVPFRFASYEGMDIGTDNGLPVVPKLEYAKILPKYFRGTIEKVEFDLGPAKLSAEDLRRIYLQRFATAVRN
ncbi:MAG TPA: arylsulfatase [Candidatus Babeliales bacterium]|nr:arylsulfatase [Candidatus Babeliales bacterium]